MENSRIDKEREKSSINVVNVRHRGQRGVALPDREPIETQRDACNSLGSIQQHLRLLLLPMRQRLDVQQRQRPLSPIANMVTSKNGTAVITPSLPLTPQAPSIPLSKIPKARGSFKAPTYPPSILKKRSGASAPPPTTATHASTIEPR